MRNFQALSQDPDLYAIVQVELIARAIKMASVHGVTPLGDVLGRQGIRLNGGLPIPGRSFLLSVGQPDIVAYVPAAAKLFRPRLIKSVIGAGSALLSSLRALAALPAPLRLPLVPRSDAAEAGRAVRQIGRYLIRQR
jgi:hypothetical protein